MTGFLKSMVMDLTRGGHDHHFSLITYATEVRTVFSFNRYSTPERVVDAITTTRYKAGRTNTAGGLRQAATLFSRRFGDRPTAKNVVVLLTDGESNENYQDTIPSAQALKDAGVKVISIGIGIAKDTELNAIASSPKDVFKVDTFDDLEKVEQDIVAGSCRGLED